MGDISPDMFANVSEEDSDIIDQNSQAQTETLQDNINLPTDKSVLNEEVAPKFVRARSPTSPDCIPSKKARKMTTNPNPHHENVCSLAIKFVFQ